MTVRDVARVCHEVNRAYCASLGDDSQPAWEDAPDWQQDSAVNGVKASMFKPFHTPEDSHKSWLAQKNAEGWTYGEVKDVAAKTHPCMLPYNELPTKQRAKDALFLAVVRSLERFIDDETVESVL